MAPGLAEWDSCMSECYDWASYGWAEELVDRGEAICAFGDDTSDLCDHGY